jgi:hypothetical protein
MAKRSSDQPGGDPIGNRQGDAPDAPKATDVLEKGKVHRRATERERLIRDPNLNQAGNDRGSGDQVQGSQTGNDVDPIPEE